MTRYDNDIENDERNEKCSGAKTSGTIERDGRTTRIIAFGGVKMRARARLVSFMQQERPCRKIAK